MTASTSRLASDELASDELSIPPSIAVGLALPWMRARSGLLCPRGTIREIGNDGVGKRLGPGRVADAHLRCGRTSTSSGMRARSGFARLLPHASPDIDNVR